ncbi:hydroxymethylbilane synthase [Legionella sp. km772]|uniref:hydroxymethylbilane synthase n=1 Tax=Legionella sp. km772 TaxID=2498111 RepID=UPI000F8F0A8D|nr:hydroxymethylbilane synthase [Legionella sp. km772]RUR12021.1 hydroxymethylbilane synthase [Legionella sp. km772]
MNARTLRIATRQSPLALWQANHIREQLLHHWPNLLVELVPMLTSGDKFLKDKLQAAGGKGLFVKELEEALLDKRADLAVHSTKDMPAFLPQGLILPVICKRDNPFDAFLSPNYPDLNSLPTKAVIGTASLRRQSQLLAHRPDLQIKTLRGNIQTRMAKLQAGEYDAIILAAAGLERMNLQHVITEVLSEDIMLPTCAQGALSIECREEDVEVQNLIAPLNDANSSLCVQTERLVNAQLGGNCHVPLAVFCTHTASRELHLRARLLSIDGSSVLHFEQTAPQEHAKVLARQCTDSLLDQGAASLLPQIHD